MEDSQPQIPTVNDESKLKTNENKEENGESKKDTDEKVDWTRVSGTFDEIMIENDMIESENEEIEQVPIQKTDLDSLEFTTEPPRWKKRLASVYPIILAIISSIFFSWMSLVVKMVSNTNSTFQITFFRSVIQGLIAAACLWFQERTTPFHVERKFLWTLISRGTIGFASSYCLFYSLGKLPLSEAVVISYVHPVFVAIVAAILLKEKWSVLDALGALLCMVGVVFIARPPFLFPQQIAVDDNGDHWVGLIFVLMHALLASFAICLIRSMGKGINALQNVAWFSIASIVYAGFGMLVTWSFHVPSSTEWAQLLGIGVLAFVGQYSMSKALQLEKAAIIATVGYIQVAFSVVNDIVFFDNFPKMWSVIGVFLICSWAIISLSKQWFKDQKTPWFTQLRLRFMGRSTAHQRVPVDQEMEQMKNNP